MPTTYEWDIETYDASVPNGAGDILDHHHEETLSKFSKDEFMEAMQENGKRLVLIRDRNWGIVSYRSWAYFLPGELPATFGNNPYGVRVLKKFRDEFERVLKKHTKTEVKA